MNEIMLSYPEKIIIEDEVFTSRGQEPKIKRVESVGKDIVDYRIEEAKLDPDGNIIPTVKPPFYETTGRSLEWTIKVGETLKFPEYVAKYLTKIYPFLKVEDSEQVQVVEASVEETSPLPVQEAKPTEGVTTCKHCGAHFTSTKGVALHIAHRHPEMIL